MLGRMAEYHAELLGKMTFGRTLNQFNVNICLMWVGGLVLVPPPPASLAMATED